MYFPFYFQQKCDKYWPEVGGVSKYGLIEVTHAREDVMTFYTLRTFRIRHTRIRQPPSAGSKGANGQPAVATERFVLQYQVKKETIKLYMYAIFYSAIY